MDNEKKTDEEILEELDSIYRRVAEETLGEISSDGLDELSGAEPEEEMPRKKPSPLIFHGALFLAVSLFAGIFLTVIIRQPAVPDIKPPVKAPSYSIPITIPKASPEAVVKTPTETEKAVAAVEDKGKEAPPAPAIIKETEKREEIEPVPEKPYTIQISAIRNFEIAKDFLKKIEVSQADVHWDRLNSKKYGVWYRVFTGHFASRKAALRYMRQKNIRDTYPGSYVVTIPASTPTR